MRKHVASVLTPRLTLPSRRQSRRHRRRPDCIFGTSHGQELDRRPRLTRKAAISPCHSADCGVTVKVVLLTGPPQRDLLAARSAELAEIVPRRVGRNRAQTCRPPTARHRAGRLGCASFPSSPSLSALSTFIPTDPQGASQAAYGSLTGRTGRLCRQKWLEMR